MPCNLAVSITKAALSDERLKMLVDEHIDQVTEILAQYLRQRHPQLRIESAGRGTGRLSLGYRLSLQIAQGSVTLTGSRTAEGMEDLSQEASVFVTLVADQLFTQEVERTLRTTASLIGKQHSDVENGGAVQRATVYAMQKDGLQVRVFVLPRGQLQIFVDTGTFEQAKVTTLQLLQGIQAQGLSFASMSEIEQHRDDVDHVHVRRTQQRGGR